MQSLLYHAFFLSWTAADLQLEGIHVGGIKAQHQHQPKHPSPVPFERGPLNCTCPDTYALVGQRCERTIRFPLETLCPPGYDKMDSYSCVKLVTPEEKCPYGYARVKSECIKREVTQPQLGCPDGFTLEATAHSGLKHLGGQLLCARKYPVATEYECPDGSSAASNCYATISAPANYTCPAGFHEGPANTCHRIADVDCGTPKNHHHPPLRKLEAGDFAYNDNPRAFADYIAADEYLSPEGDSARFPKKGYEYLSPRQYHPQPAQPKEHSGHKNPHIDHDKPWKGHHVPKNDAISLSVTHTCTANVTIEATPYCEFGELRGRLCAELVPTEPVEVCPAFGNLDDCYAYERRNTKSECPHGYARECAVKTGSHKTSFDCECVETLIASVEVLCPPGAEFINGLCEFTTPPYSGCPLGSRMVDEACEELQFKPCVCTYSVNFACQGVSCGHHAYLKH